MDADADRHHMHDMALRQERESVLKQTRLRAVGILAITRVPIQDRLANKFANRLGNQPKTKTRRTIRIKLALTKGNDVRATTVLFADIWQKIARILPPTK